MLRVHATAQVVFLYHELRLYTHLNPLSLHTLHLSLYTTRSQHNLVLVFGAIATTPLQVAAKSAKYRIIASARRTAVQSWLTFISEFVQHHYSGFSSQTPEIVLMQFGDGAWFLLRNPHRVSWSAHTRGKTFHPQIPERDDIPQHLLVFDKQSATSNW